MAKDWVIWFCCLMLIGIGFLLGSNTDLFTNIKITDWLTSIGTIGAVVVALWSVNENHRRDTYQIKATAKVYEDTVLSINSTRKPEKRTIIVVRIANTGKRPITLEKLLIYSAGVEHSIPLLIEISSEKSQHPILEPGAFFIVYPLISGVQLSFNEAIKANYLILDALEIKHKAELILN